MTQTPTTHDLTSLAKSIAEHGIAGHVEGLDRLALAADRVSLFPGSAAVLRDRQSGDLQRARAFNTLYRNWARIVEANKAKADFDATFVALAKQWRSHQELRETGDLARLWSSRRDLDTCRLKAATAAHARTA